MGNKNSGGKTADRVANVILSNCVCFFGAPDISIADKEHRFTGTEVLQFCRDSNIALQTAMPVYRRSLGDTERRHRYFKDITHPIIDGRKRKKVESKVRGDMHLFLLCS